MNSTKPVMPFQSSIGLSITTACPITCSHCIIKAGPSRKTRMTIPDATSWLRQAAEYRQHHITSVVITGGEPFYDTDLLGSILDLSIDNGLVPAVVTNAFWADTPQNACRLLASMPQIKMLSISTDKYHSNYIPVTNIQNALSAVRRLGIACSLGVCIDNDDDAESTAFLADLKKMTHEESILVSYVYPAGRAQKKSTKETVPALKTEHCCCSGAEAPIIFPDGRVVACMGILDGLSADHPLLLGNLKTTPLAEILSNAEENLFLHILRLWGITAIVPIMREHGIDERLLNTLLEGTNCDLCYLLTKDPLLLRQLNAMLSGPELEEKIAYARQFYLDEVPLST